MAREGISPSIKSRKTRSTGLNKIKYAKPVLMNDKDQFMRILPRHDRARSRRGTWNESKAWPDNEQAELLDLVHNESSRTACRVTQRTGSSLHKVGTRSGDDEPPREEHRDRGLGKKMSAANLTQLCSVFVGATSSIDAVENSVASLLSQGECGRAKLLLDATEMRSGQWLSQLTPTRLQLAITHLLLLLCENDLDNARLLTRRWGLSGELPAQLAQCQQLYTRLWAGDSVGATDLAHRMKHENLLAQMPLAASALEHFSARLHTRQLNLLQRAYSAVSVETFGRNAGLATTSDVENFCKWSPDLYQVRDGFVYTAPMRAVEGADNVAAHIEKLTKLIVFLEGETTTRISGKLPSTGGAAEGNSQN